MRFAVLLKCDKCSKTHRLFAASSSPPKVGDMHKMHLCPACGECRIFTVKGVDKLG